jgi:ferrous iron transport protein B
MHHGSDDKVVLKDSVSMPTIVLVGNANVGKSVIFSILTGKYVTVSNYPGTTVEIAKGNSSFDGGAYRVIDTPGANSLIPRSEDERVARDMLLKENSMTVIQVADSKNLRRSLIMTSQMAEMGVPMVLALNMADEAKSAGIRIGAKKLSERLGVPVVETVAVERRGMNKLGSIDLFRQARQFQGGTCPGVSGCRRENCGKPPARAGLRGIACNDDSRR